MSQSENKIRNFSIIAHVDHGKSTLADRMLELTKTVEGRKMQDQVLDSMDLERERGITIKMRPVRMNYQSPSGEEFVLNMIDTPGHIDFSYEVSRSLKAVEGSIVLVDATQGVQAQTLTTLWMALEEDLDIIPVLSKVDSPLARVDEIRAEVVELIGCRPEDVLETSGKTGAGVAELLQRVVDKVPPPDRSRSKLKDGFQSLVFDFEYSNHQGVIVYVRVMSGRVERGDSLVFKIAGETFSANEVGIFTPDHTPRPELVAGEIGYIVTGIKQANVASVGDTVSSVKSQDPPFPGYKEPQPIVWASVYPESQDDFVLLRQSLERMKLSDSALSFEEESSHSLGKGFRCGFLGMLHLEIVTERLKREFNLDLVITTPSVIYQVTDTAGTQKSIYSPHLFPNDHDVSLVEEPWVDINIITPMDRLNTLMPILHEHETVIGGSDNVGSDRVSLQAGMPLRELMRNFFDRVKSASSGFASVSYELSGNKKAEVTRLDILVAGELMPIFSRVVAKHKVLPEAKQVVDKLYNILPRQMFVTKIQAQAGGRIQASKTLSALKKDVTGHLYGGDITRKMKLRENQKKGKKRLQQRGQVRIPPEVFVKMVRNDQ